MNIPRHQVEERLAFIRAAIASGQPLSAVTERFSVARNNVRELMQRHGIALPLAWVARPCKKHGPKLPDGSPFLPHMQGDPATLSPEVREAAGRFGIKPHRAAWLCTAQHSFDLPR